MHFRWCVRPSQQAVSPTAHARFVRWPIPPAWGQHHPDFLALDNRLMIGYDCTLTLGRRLPPAAMTVPPCGCQPQFNPGNRPTGSKGRFNERSGNVYENKGPLWGTPDGDGKPSPYGRRGRTCPTLQRRGLPSACKARKISERSRNVYENKGSLWRNPASHEKPSPYEPRGYALPCSRGKQGVIA